MGMLGGSRRVLWRIQNLLGEEREFKIRAWWLSAMLGFLFYSFWHFQYGKCTNSFIMWLSNSPHPCNRTYAEGWCISVATYWFLCLHASSCLRCWDRAHSIIVIPECALGATKPCQKPGQPAPYGQQPWAPLMPWGGCWTSGVWPRLIAFYIVYLLHSAHQAGTAIWRPPWKKKRGQIVLRTRKRLRELFP